MNSPSLLQARFANHTVSADDAGKTGELLRQWLIGAATALSTIAVWALMVWLGVLLVQAVGLLPPSAPA